MSTQGSGANSQLPMPSDRLLDRFFFHIERFAHTHSLMVVFISVLVASLSVWVTVENLTFKNNRGDLVAKKLPYVELYENYRQEFEDFDGMILVVEDENPQRMKGFTEAFVKKLNQHPEDFSRVYHKIDTDYFKGKGLLYLDRDELFDLGKKIKSHENFLDRVNASPGLNQLVKSINAEISTGMVDSLLTGFLGSGNEEENEKDETADLSLLIALEQQMIAHLRGEGTYRSPWKSFLTDSEESVAEEGYLVSEDEKLMFVLIVPNEDNKEAPTTSDSVDFLRRLIEETRTQFPGVEVGLTGEDVIAADEMDTTKVDVRKASQIALIGVALLFILAYREVVKPLLAIFALVVALCWSMGWTTLVVGHLNILTVVFATILIGLGIDFGIHILERYREERVGGAGVLQALQKTVQGTGRGNFAGAVTTSMAFGGMILTDFIGIVELGKISAGGIMLCMLSMILLLPALITVEEKIRKPQYPSILSKANGRLIEKLFEHYYAIIFVSLVLFAVALLSLRTVAFDYNLLNLQAHGTEAVKYEMKVIENAERSAWSTAILSDSLDDAFRKHHALKQLPTVGKVESIASILPEKQDEKIEYIKTLSPILNNLQVEEGDATVALDRLVKVMKKIQFKLQGKEGSVAKEGVAEARKLAKQFLGEVKSVAPESAQKRLNNFSKQLFADYREEIAHLKKNADTTPVRVEEIPENLRERFVSPNGVYLINVYPGVDVWDINQRNEFIRQVKQVASSATGNAMHMFESTRLMKDGYIHGGIYAMIAIFLYVLISFNSLRTALIVLLPVVVGSVWTVGIMDLVDVSFNLANLVILPLIIGIGVVNGVHIVHRYREETDKTMSILTRSTGPSVILSSLTTMIGFGSLMVADHQGVFSLGLVLSLGVGSCLVASVTVLPAVLKLCTAQGWKV